MELSATTMTTTTNNNVANSQQGANNYDISPTSGVNNNSIANIRSSSTLSSPNGNDSSQSHIQKQSATNLSINNVSVSPSSIMANVSKTKDDCVQKSLKSPNDNGNQITFPEKPKSHCEINTPTLTIREDSNQDDFIPQPNSQKRPIFGLEDNFEVVGQVIESILERLEAELLHSQVSTASQSSSLIVNENSCSEITSFVTPVDDDDDEVNKPKDIVTLKNLELTPSPLPTDDRVQTPEGPRNRKGKRTHSESIEKNNEPTTEGRSKRQRKQTQLFQVGEADDTRSAKRESTDCFTPAVKRSASVSSRKKSKKSATKQVKSKSPSPVPPPPILPPSSQIPPDVIYYEKNDFLALRNEENTFYLCQLTENVRVQKEVIKIKWLDTKDSGKTYFLTSHQDKVPQKSIIMPVRLNKLKSEKKGQHLFSLDDQEKENIIDRLKRSLNSSRETEQR